MTLPSVFSLKTTAITGAVALAVGIYGGWKLHDGLIHQPHLRADAAAALKAVNDARKTEGKGTEIAGQVRDQHDTKQFEIRTVTNTIIKEVPRYVSSTVKCPAAVAGAPDRIAVADVSVGFSLLHDAAARGNPPLPPAAGVDLDAPRGIGMPAVAGVIVRNYGVCRGWRAEAEAWRSWYARESAAWPVKPDMPVR